MKKVNYIILMITGILFTTSCEYDNYEEPSSILEGRFVYNDQAVGVKSDLDVIRLYEEGWQKFTPITVSVKHDGTFRAALFNGDYKMALVAGNGPWQNISDTIAFQFMGNKTLDIAVEPFFWPHDEDYKLNGTTLSASFDIDQVVEDKNIEFVALYIGKTALVDNLYNAKNLKLQPADIPNLDQRLSIDMDLSDIGEDFVYARVGIKTRGNQELVFTQAQKITL